MNSVMEREAAELRFWEESPTESPSSDSIENIVEKAAEARVFLEKLRLFGSLFEGARDILELGGGQCWASCIVKRKYPRARVTASDISPAAIASLHKWEHVYRTKVDRAQVCRAFETRFSDASFDLVFAYSAAHHFVRHRRTIRELARILRPGGAALYLQEPGCQPFAYRAAVRRVNRKRPEVPEDVLRYRELARLARQAGLEAEVRFAPTLTNRGPLQAVYFLALSKLPALQHALPTTVDIVIRKPA